MFHRCDKMCLLTFIIISFAVNTSAQLISTYAKVARWGAGATSENEGRSRGQTLWTQRSEANIRENPKNQRQPTHYRYSMKAPSSKLDYSSLDEIPSKGEVQERFHPRPYFDFVFDNKPNQKQPEPKPPSIVYASPMNAKPPSDSYSSPFSSYNPPQVVSNNFQNTPPELLNFPPYTNSNFSEAKPPPAPLPPNLPPDDSFHPPLVAPGYERPVFVPQLPEDGDAPMEDPKDEEKPPEDTTYLDHPPPEFDYHYHHSPKPPSMAEEDLAPPPPIGFQFPKIPQYLDHKPDEHDFYHFNHHDVYHEETTTKMSTTTSAPRAGHYSYYYLGRKLWYIPLYFSVYFIIYVTILILKSIARHKIQFTHNFDKSRSFGELNSDYVNGTVIDAIENVDNRFM